MTRPSYSVSRLRLPRENGRVREVWIPKMDVRSKMPFLVLVIVAFVALCYPMADFIYWWAYCFLAFGKVMNTFCPSSLIILLLLYHKHKVNAFWWIPQKISLKNNIIETRSLFVAKNRCVYLVLSQRWDTLRRPLCPLGVLAARRSCPTGMAILMVNIIIISLLRGFCRRHTYGTLPRAFVGLSTILIHNRTQ